MKTQFFLKIAGILCIIIPSLSHAIPGSIDPGVMSQELSSQSQSRQEQYQDNYQHPPVIIYEHQKQKPIKKNNKNNYN